VLLDIATNDPNWAHWSLRQLDAAAVRGPVLINSVVYAEFSVGYTHVEEVDRVLEETGLELAEMPRAALFLAGKVFQRYRTKGGTRTGVLPDFFIGAHAAVAQFPLLTRDPRRYRTHFSGIALIAPDQPGAI
jgi:predicted nucleic acid-binding protein